ncbi:hypothetical protein EHQ16_00530 [Leptospira kanakyensis]|uniref:DUF3291 domain-containing protein n=1 Tax=Leptospira kanakyensis TaxID=2484968 RepID=A0A6N4Q4S9_9LEPT|nr:hypothetical protein [Leptospira kanakyensis]TGK46137.1 hypothetical protein EHQ11_19520 [Leptospira kanakyensis]TGK65074.1 hypothetical protein EHQ16_00530 [Leptospira kanakyensis]TGK65506.1 hypothetical protein EHQ18_19740 [Leptospira kanakyensis]
MSEIQFHTQEIFSFHQFELPFYKLPYYLFFYLKRKKVKGLIHAETLLPMQLGESILSKNRYFFSRVVLVAFWKSEEDLDLFLNLSPRDPMRFGWQIRLRLYRRWGKIKELDSATLYPKNVDLAKPVIAITLARLKISQLFRFTKWGKPVEKQVRDHPGKKIAFAAFRPFRNFLTFSIWNSEKDMIDMVHGMDSEKDGLEHKEAMVERNRKDFHTEFTTLRFEILKEINMNARN